MLDETVSILTMTPALMLRAADRNALLSTIRKPLLPKQAEAMTSTQIIPDPRTQAT